MKKIYLLTLLFVGLTFSNFAQEDCYNNYKKVFENRGANAIQDGVHDNVIMTIRKNGVTECVMVSVTVKNLEIVKVEVYYEDNSKEMMVFNFADKEFWSVTNGISKTRVTSENEQINLFFTSLLKPKKKKYKTAPLPNFELND